MESSTIVSIMQRDSFRHKVVPSQYGKSICSCKLLSYSSSPNLSRKTEQNKLEIESMSSEIGEKMSIVMDFAGVPTPPPSEAGSRCHSADFSNLSGYDVNNTSTTSPSLSQTPFPQSPPTPPSKSRRDLQKEANRSRQFTTRLQRSATTGSEDGEAPFGREGRRRRFHRPTSLPAKQNQTDEALKAVEPLHEPVLTKMAYAEQQKWITVQQKTFTKWYAVLPLLGPGGGRLTNYHRLNTKIEPRELMVKDLVHDLSDGVCSCYDLFTPYRTDFNPYSGHTHPPPRMPL